MKLTVVLTLISLFLLMYFSGCNNQTNMAPDNKTISVNDVMNKLNDPNVKIIDVRTESEYTAEHLSNALLIPLDVIQEKISSYSDIDKNSEILVYCRSGNRSMQALKILNSLGYTNVKSMTGGMLSWDKEGYKVCTNTEKTC